MIRIPAPQDAPLPTAAGEPAPVDEARGRAAEVASLFSQHNRLLVRFLRARLGSEQEAKEVAQEAYVKVLQLDRTGAVGFLRAYLFKVATNLAIDRLRQRGRQGEGEDIELFEDLAGDVEPERRVIAAEQLAILARAIEELPPRSREAFLLYRLQDRKQTDIAAQVGLTDRMIRKHIAYAMLYCKLRVEGMSPEAAKKACS